MSITRVCFNWGNCSTESSLSWTEYKNCLFSRVKSIYFTLPCWQSGRLYELFSVTLSRYVTFSFCFTQCPELPIGWARRGVIPVATDRWNCRAAPPAQSLEFVSTNAAASPVTAVVVRPIYALCGECKRKHVVGRVTPSINRCRLDAAIALLPRQNH